MKKRMISVILCMVMVLTAGCGKKGTADAGTEGAGKYEGEELNVFLWPEYIPDSVIGDFEDAYGVTVNVSTFSSNEEMLSKLQNSTEGTYDVINPSDYMVEYMAENDLLAELDKDILKNYDNLDEQYLGQFYDTENKYSVPFAPGEIILAYDKNAVSDEITCLDDIFDEKYKSSIVVLDDPKIVIGMVNKSLGFGLNETDGTKLEQTRERLLAFKDNVYSLKFEATQDMLLSGECSVGYIFNGNTAIAQMESDDIEAVFPKEGSYVWIDNLCIPADCTRQELANEFINYILDAEVDAKIREEIPSTDPNKAGWELVSDELKDTALAIPKESWDNSEYAANLDEETNQTYTNMYAEFTK